MRSGIISRFLPLIAALVVAGCASEGGVLDSNSYDFIDRDKELSRKDYESIAKPSKKQRDEAEEAGVSVIKGAVVPPVPEITQILAAPRPPKIGETKLVTLAVTDDVPLKDVLVELARLADVDIELGSGIEGGVSFRAKDRPFNEVIERIADLTGLRYSMKNGVLRVERDTPYVKNYSIDFLNIVRNSASSVNISTDVLSSSGDSGGSGGDSGGGSSGGGGLATGTTSSIESSTESDFWAGLEANLSQILNYVSQGLQSTANQPSGGATAGELGVASGGGTASGASGASGSSLGTALSGTSRGGGYYVINRQAGIITISASQRQHDMISQYLKVLERNYSAQVLIEAKILEVQLDKNYQSGVNWSSVIGNSDFNISFPTSVTNSATYAILGPGKDTTDGVGAANPTGDNNLGVNLDAVVQFTEKFGTSRTISSPRLHAINNQQAVLTFAQNRIFYEVEVQREDDQVVNDTILPGQTTVTSTRRSVPIGIVMSLLPSVNLDKNEVTLSVRPTLSRQVDTVEDPGSALLRDSLGTNSTFVNQVPVIEVRELDSVMKLKSGSVMVIGGLMEDVTQNTDEGVPGISSVPWIGNAFKNTAKADQKKELIILIKATIVNPTGNYDPADRTIYNKFTDDPRSPFK